MKKVLILGAGMVAGPPVKYLLNKGFNVTVASRTKNKAEQLINNHSNGEAKTFDITKASDDEFEELIRNSDLVVSLLPYIYHIKVAKACIKYKKHMVTTSYVSPEMKELDGKAKEAGIIILNEIGVDPGIDHMEAQRIIDKVHAKGGKITAFKSYCGGLPAPDANTNPWGYKLSWSPRGVILAGRNAAKYLDNEKIVEISGEDLFDHHFDYTVEGVEGNYEAYPNRDSTPYIDIYMIPETKTMFRGTIRNKGWSRTLKKVAETGFLNIQEQEFPTGFTYNQLTSKLLGKPEGNDAEKAFLEKFKLTQNDDVVKRMRWMGLFSDEQLPSNKISPLDALCAQWEKRLQYNPGERDMLILVHEFEYKLPEGNEKVTSTMIDFGIKNADTSMSRTVGLPAAIGIRMILEGIITDTGVHIPVSKTIYEPILAELAELGISFVQKTEKL